MYGIPILELLAVAVVFVAVLIAVSTIVASMIIYSTWRRF